MAMKHITDAQVCEAYRDAMISRDHWFDGRDIPGKPAWPYQILAKRTGQPEKVCYRCCERACSRGYIEYGVSLRSGWLTDKGRELIGEPPQDKDWQRPPAVSVRLLENLFGATRLEILKRLNQFATRASQQEPRP